MAIGVNGVEAPDDDDLRPAPLVAPPPPPPSGDPAAVKPPAGEQLGLLRDDNLDSGLCAVLDFAPKFPLLPLVPRLLLATFEDSGDNTNRFSNDSANELAFSSNMADDFVVVAVLEFPILYRPLGPVPIPPEEMEDFCFWLVILSVSGCLSGWLSAPVRMVEINQRSTRKEWCYLKQPPVLPVFQSFMYIRGYQNISSIGGCMVNLRYAATCIYDTLVTSF